MWQVTYPSYQCEGVLHYWVYLGTYIGTYLLVTGYPTTRDTSRVVSSVPWLCAMLHDTNSHMRVHTYEFVCNCSDIQFRTYDEQNKEAGTSYVSLAR